MTMCDKSIDKNRDKMYNDIGQAFNFQKGF